MCGTNRESERERERERKRGLKNSRMRERERETLEKRWFRARRSKVLWKKCIVFCVVWVNEMSFHPNGAFSGNGGEERKL